MSWLLILAVATVGGLVAFLGDRVGMRVGKKRLTLFGLRPKYTSIIIAVLSGVLTAAATLGLLTAGSKEVNIAVFHLNQLRKDNKTLAIDNKTLTNKNSSLITEYREARQNLAGLTRELKTVSRNLQETNEKIAALTLAKERASDEFARKQADLQTTAASLVEAKQQYETVQAQLIKAQDDLKEVNKQKKILEEYITIAKATAEQTQEDSIALGTGVLEFASQAIVIHIDEVLATRLVKPGLHDPDIKLLLEDTLKQADLLARQRGARIENKEISSKIELAGYANAFKTLLDGKGPVVLRVLSKTNVLAGKPAFIYLDVSPDAIAIKQGGVIASIKVNGLDPADRILDRVVSELLPAARKTMEDRIMVDAEGNAAVPLIGLEKIQQAIEAARAIKGPAKIELTAAKELWRVSNGLDLRLQTTKTTL